MKSTSEVEELLLLLLPLLLLLLLLHLLLQSCWLVNLVLKCHPRRCCASNMRVTASKVVKLDSGK